MYYTFNFKVLSHAVKYSIIIMIYGSEMNHRGEKNFVVLDSGLHNNSENNFYMQISVIFFFYFALN